MILIVKVLNDKHTKIHVDRFNISVIDRLIKIGMVWGGFDANSALLFQRLAEYSSQSLQKEPQDNQ